MDIRELTARSNLRQNARFYQALDTRAMAIASNPALIATPTQRAADTGEVILQTADGGTARGRYIGNASLPTDSPVPAFTRGANTGFVDTKIVRA